MNKFRIFLIKFWFWIAHRNIIKFRKTMCIDFQDIGNNMQLKMVNKGFLIVLFERYILKFGMNDLKKSIEVKRISRYANTGNEIVALEKKFND